MRNIIITGANGKLSCKVALWLKVKDRFNVKQMSLRGNWQGYDFSNTYSIIHIAGVTPQNAKNDSDYKKINYELTKELSAKAKVCGVKHFVYVSSMAVYGIKQSIDPKNGTVDENTLCVPQSEYGKSKLAAEEYLRTLRDENFKVCIIRVPSIFDSEKTEYIDQYKYLASKLPVIPKCFTKNYKSFIHSDNLCELIYLAIDSDYDGTICPDDGRFSAFDVCKAIYPKKLKSRLLGRIIELVLKNNSRVEDYYGTVCYNETSTGVFDGKYRVTDTLNAIRKLYEE